METKLAEPKKYIVINDFADIKKDETLIVSKIVTIGHPAKYNRYLCVVMDTTPFKTPRFETIKENDFINLIEKQ